MSMYTSSKGIKLIKLPLSYCLTFMFKGVLASVKVVSISLILSVYMFEFIVPLPVLTVIFCVDTVFSCVNITSFLLKIKLLMVPVPFKDKFAFNSIVGSPNIFPFNTKSVFTINFAVDEVAVIEWIRGSSSFTVKLYSLSSMDKLLLNLTFSKITFELSVNDKLGELMVIGTTSSPLFLPLLIIRLCTIGVLFNSVSYTSA